MRRLMMRATAGYVLALGVLLLAAPLARGLTAGMSLEVGGSNSVAVDESALPTTINAELVSTNIDTLFAYEADLQELSGLNYFTVSSSNNAPPWATGFGESVATADLLDPSTRDSGELVAQISAIDGTGSGVASPALLQTITIDIASGPTAGEIYLIEIHNATLTDASFLPATPVALNDLEIMIVPEPTIALLLLAGFPFWRRRTNVSA